MSYVLEVAQHKPLPLAGKWGISDKSHAMDRRHANLVWCLEDNNPHYGPRKLSGNVNPVRSLSSIVSQDEVFG